MSNPLDALWSWGERAFPVIRRAGADDASTQLHHSIVCVFVGAIGGTAAVAFHLPFGVGFRIAWGLCWLAYLVREIRQHWGKSWPWDAYGDVLLPICWTAAALVAGSDRALYALIVASAVVALLYVVLRPKAL